MLTLCTCTTRLCLLVSGISNGVNTYVTSEKLPHRPDFKVCPIPYPAHPPVENPPGSTSRRQFRVAATAPPCGIDVDFIVMYAPVSSFMLHHRMRECCAGDCVSHNHVHSYRGNFSSWQYEFNTQNSAAIVSGGYLLLQLHRIQSRNPGSIPPLA